MSAGAGEAPGPVLGGGRRPGLPHIMHAQTGPLGLVWSVGSGDEHLDSARLTFLSARNAWERALAARGPGLRERVSWQVLVTRTVFLVEPGPEAREDLRALAEALRKPAAPDRWGLASWAKTVVGASADADAMLSAARWGRRGPGLEGTDAVLVGQLTPSDVLEWTRRHAEPHRVGLLVDASSGAEASDVVATWGAWDEAADGGQDWRRQRERAALPSEDAVPPGMGAPGNALLVEGESWGLSFAVPRSPRAEALVSLVLAEILERLERLVGPPAGELISCSVVGTDHYLVVEVVGGARAVDPLAAREAILDSLTSLSEEGPTERVVQRAVREELEAFTAAQDAHALPLALLEVLVDPLLVPPGTGELSAPDGDELETGLGLAIVTHVFCIGDGALAAALGGADRDTGHPIRWRGEDPFSWGEGRRYRRAWFGGGPRGYAAWDDGEWLVLGEARGRWEEIVAMIEGPSAQWWVWFEDGGTGVLRGRWLRKGGALEAELRRRVPERRWVTRSELDRLAD